MRIAYFDCFSGVSGDMILAALLDAGLDLAYLKRELKKLRLRGYSIKAKKVKKANFVATKFDVVLDNRSACHNGSSLNDIKRIINRSRLNIKVKELSCRIFENLAIAEQASHGARASQTHFHEIGDTDALVDIVGAAIALDYLEISRIYSSGINVGSGTVKTAHGTLPVSAPATSFLLKGIPIYSSGDPYELTTPTGAAILKTACKGFGQLPLMKIEQVGCGAGSFDIKGMPNILRVFIGSDGQAVDAGYERDTVTVIEANIDDMNLVGAECVLEKIFQAGALDVCYQPVYMKKARLGMKLTALAEKRNLAQVLETIFQETPTFGVRTYEVQRYKLPRLVKTIKTKYGRCRVKIGGLNIKVGARCSVPLQVSPEYEDCKALSVKRNVPFWKVYDEVKRKGLSLISEKA